MRETEWLRKGVSCPICGKKFHPTDEWVYRKHKTTTPVCSWHCVLESERTKRVKRTGPRQKFAIVCEDGFVGSAKQVADHLGILNVQDIYRKVQRGVLEAIPCEGVME